MATSNQQGTRIYYATAGTSWSALAAGANPSGSWTQVTRGVNVNVVPHESETFDPNPLESGTPSAQNTLKPGSATFGLDEQDAQSVALRTICDNQTKKMWAFLYLDGTADTSDGYLTCTKVAAQKGDYKALVQEEYKVLATGSFTRQAKA